MDPVPSSPAAPPAPPFVIATDPSDMRTRRRQGHWRVLVVDDDDACRVYLAEAFEYLGCQSTQAADAGEALRLFSEQPPDLVCSDLRMAGLDGLEFLDLVRARAPHVPCIVVSGCEDTSAIAEARRRGVTTFLRKPASLADLERIVQRLTAADHPPAGSPPTECATPTAQETAEDGGHLSEPLSAHLLHKTSQLSFLTQFAGALRATAGAHAGDPLGPSLANLTALVVGRGLEITRRALGAQQATLCLVEGGTVRPVTASEADATPLPVAQAVTHIRAAKDAQSWHGVIDGMPVVAAALVIQGEAVGVLCAGREPTSPRFAWSDAELLAAFSEQTALALENACLGRQLEQAFQASVTSLIIALEAKHKYTEGHSLRVAQYAAAISETLALPPIVHQRVWTSALLHDLGKVGVRDDVLDKPAKLTEAEWAVMREHPILGARILGSLGFLSEEARIVRHHHERLDGTGYPDGLAGDAIPLAARIVAVADAFDAMRSARSYRPAMPEDAALGELQRWAGIQFDVAAVDALRSWLATQQTTPSPESLSGFAHSVPILGLQAGNPHAKLAT